MSQSPAPASKKPLIAAISLVGLAAAAAGVYFYMQSQEGPMVTDLYKYYPQDTAMFVELAPGDKLTARFFRGVDALKDLKNDDKAQPDIQLATVFEKDLESEISIGTWDVESATAQQAPPFLLVVSTKPGVTLDTLVTDLQLPKESFSVTTEEGTSFLRNQSKQAVVAALHENHLVMGDSETSIRKALDEFKTPESVIDNPLFKDNMKLLPSERQGTVFVSMKSFQEVSAKEQKNPGMDKFAQLQKQIQAATPVMLGSMAVENDQLLMFDTFTPVDASKIESEGFRKDLLSLYGKQDAFKLAGLLPQDTVLFGGMAGLSGYYDLYMNYIATDEEKSSVGNVESQLKMVGLDLRKNIVSLLEGNAAVGVSMNQAQPNVLLFLTSTPETDKALDQFGMMAAQMTGGKVQEQPAEEGHPLKVVSSPAMPFKVGYSTVQPGTVVLGTQTGVEQVYAVKQNKKPSLEDSNLMKELWTNMPEKVNGLFFMNLKEGAAMLDELAKKQGKKAPGADVQMKQVLQGIEGIAGTNVLEGTNMLRGRVRIKLAPAS